MQRQCERCGSVFEAKRERARYCSSSCRGMATKERARSGEKQVVDLPKPSSAHAGLSTAVERQLREVGKLDSYVGQQAVFLAQRLEASTVDTGSAVAALSKELDRLMSAILAEAEPDTDELDEIQGKVVAMRSRRHA